MLILVYIFLEETFLNTLYSSFPLEVTILDL